MSEPTGLTSPVSNKMKKMRPMAVVHSIPKLTVPHSPKLATAKRSHLRDFAHPEEKFKVLFYYQGFLSSIHVRF